MSGTVLWNYVRDEISQPFSKLDYFIIFNIINHL